MPVKKHRSQVLVGLNKINLHSPETSTANRRMLALTWATRIALLLLGIVILSSCAPSASSLASSTTASTGSPAILSPKSTFTPEVLPAGKAGGKSQMAVIFDKEWVYINNGAKINLGDGLLMELFVDPYPPTRLRAFLDVYLTRDDLPVTDAEVEIVYDMLGMFHGPFNFAADNLAGGHYLITVDYIMFGAWEHLLVIQMPEIRYELPIGIIVFPTVIPN